MDTASTQIVLVLEYLVKPLQIGTNLALVQLMWCILNGSFLHSRGAIHSALSHSQYDRQTIQRCWRVVRYGVWSIEELLWRWQQWCEQETTWQPHDHGGWQPVAFDITTFWRPKLKKWQGRGFHRIAGKLMPGVPVGVVVRVGQIEGQRIPLLLKLIRASKTLKTNLKCWTNTISRAKKGRVASFIVRTSKVIRLESIMKMAV